MRGRTVAVGLMTALAVAGLAAVVVRDVATPTLTVVDEAPQRSLHVVFVGRTNDGGGDLYTVRHGQVQPLIARDGVVYVAVDGDPTRGRAVTVSMDADGVSALEAVDLTTGEPTVLARGKPDEIFADVAVATDGAIAVSVTDGATGRSRVTFHASDGEQVAEVPASDLAPSLAFPCSELDEVSAELRGWRPGETAELLVLAVQQGCEVGHADAWGVLPSGDSRRLTAVGTLDGATWLSSDGAIAVDHADQVYRVETDGPVPDSLEAVQPLARGREIAGSGSGRLAMIRPGDVEVELSYQLAVREANGEGNSQMWTVPRRQARLPEWAGPDTVLLVASTPDRGAELFAVPVNSEPTQLTDLGLWITSFDGWMTP